MSFLRKKLSILLVWITAISLLNSGCIAFHPESAKKDKDGYYVKHYWSCGPKAIYKSLRYFGEYKKRSDISKEIQSSGNITRSSLLLIHHEFVSATFPCEIKQYYYNNNFNVKELNSLDQLKNGDVAIVLVKGSILKGEEFHWLCYPNDKRIKDFYGENTEIIKVYLISKNS